MVGFSDLTVKGFRRLKSVHTALRPLNVLIGANGVGKSSFLDIFDLLAASADGQLATTITGMGGMNSLVTADGNTDSIAFSVRTNEEGTPQRDYALQLDTRGYGYTIASESLSDASSEQPVKYLTTVGGDVRYWNGKRLIAPDWEYNRQETALSQTPRNYKWPERFRRFVASVSDIHHGLDVSQRAPVRLPQALSPTTMPGANGEDLVSCLYTIRETAHDRFEVILDALRVAFPAFERLDFPLVAAGRGTIAWQERGFNRPFYANELSEGTLRFLWLVTLLQSPSLPEITLIDEPEVSLHPEMLRVLIDLLREASDRTQIIVATHSDRFVRFLQPSELLVCDFGDETGEMTAQWANDVPNLDEWLGEYSLDELWGKGIIGGRS